MEAVDRAHEIRASLDACEKRIDELDTEAQRDGTTVERRGEIIDILKREVKERNDLQVEYEKAYNVKREYEDKPFGLAANLTSERAAERSARAFADGSETREYEQAWAAAILTGHQGEARSLLSTSSHNLLTPKTLADEIADVVKKGGNIVSLCSQTSIKGQTEYPIATSYTDPVLHNETGADSKVEKEITLTSAKMEAQFIAEILRTTRKFEADSIDSFFTWLLAELPDAIRRAIDTKILIGGQGNNDGVHGILTNVDSLFVETLANQNLVFSTPHHAISLLGEGVDTVTFVMNRKTFYNRYLNLTDASGRPIYQVMTHNDGKVVELFGGHPVVFSSALPSYDDASPGQPYIVAGDFKAYMLNFPQGMEVKIIRDELTDMQKNIVRYLSEIYVAGNIVRPASFVKVTK
jgi:HK97 family phage major capsid protein